MHVHVLVIGVCQAICTMELTHLSHSMQFPAANESFHKSGADTHDTDYGYFVVAVGVVEANSGPAVTHHPSLPPISRNGRKRVSYSTGGSSGELFLQKASEAPPSVSSSLSTPDSPATAHRKLRKVDKPNFNLITALGACEPCQRGHRKCASHHYRADMDDTKRALASSRRRRHR